MIRIIDLFAGIGGIRMGFEQAFADDEPKTVFVSEWGTANSDGNGNPDQSRNQSWQDYMNKHKLSWANWSASYINEGTAAFQDGSNKNSLQYTTSGNLVKGYLATNPTSYKACKAEEEVGIKAPAIAGGFSVSLEGKTLNIAGGNANVEIYSLLGNKFMAVENVSGALSLASLPSGSYVVRVNTKEGSKTMRVQVR